MPDDHAEREPDYRFTLANERTFLAWMRTSLALLAGGIALRELVEPFEVSGARTGLAVTALALSLVLAVASYVRWVRVQQAMRRGEPLPRPLAVPLLATGITVVGAAAGLFVLLG
jgi:putative membrane protein